MSSTSSSHEKRYRNGTFLKAAATLAAVIGGLSVTLTTEAKADYLNPTGNTASSGFSQNGAAISSATNNGTINTGAYGIANWSGSSITTVINAGTMNVNAYGIANFSSAMGTVTNSGTINTNSYAVANFDASTTMGTFLNSGTITATSAYAFANFGGATITNFTNSGTISSAFCAVNNGDSTITNFTNSGTLAGGSFYAIMNSGHIGVLTLSSNSHTNGGIVNDGTIDTLNIAAGADVTGNITNNGTIGTLNISGVATSANFDLTGLGASITGTQPLHTNLNLTAPSHTAYVAVGGHAAGIDTSAFGARAASVRQMSDSVSRLANTNGAVRSIEAKSAQHAADPYTQTSNLCVDGAPAPAGQVGNSEVWIRGFMGRTKADATSDSADYVNTYSGGAVGFERDWSEDIRVGAFLGAGHMRTGLGAALGSSETNLTFIGGYATITRGTLFAKLGLTGGWGKNTDARSIVAATLETAIGKYDSWYLSPEATVGKVHDLGQHLGGALSVTPTLSVRYVYAQQEAYTESGATNNLSMNRATSGTIEERAELKFCYATKVFNEYGLKINAGFGGLAQQINGSRMSGTLLGAPLSFASPGSDHNSGLVGTLGMEVNRGKYTFSAFGDYVSLSAGNADISANAVFSVKF